MPIQSLLLDAAEGHFAQHGVLGTRLADIREEVGVSVGGIYHHFPSKKELYAEVWLRALGEYQDMFRAVLAESTGARGGIEGVVASHLEWVAANPDRATILVSPRPPGINERAAEGNRIFFRTVMAWWRTHQNYGSVRRLDFDVLNALWLGPAQEYSRHWLAGSIATDPTSVAPDLARAAWNSLRSQE
ncbi:TetR family transcriptional regulator [Rhodococcus sp. WMMA185]|uniref:TetR/AcrR family transcriptional regulator n=1 Tax=Rhodococcus sp. WMMA185 TaxID=679318 RepID=UPI0008788FA7|nr:TetR/AcrR family transcriptional regulator [Rhodococcus sp. WMMA185]AOW94885.1 TetR family transcriptional regulator [Rhodococcus sp. WMMA185]